MVWNPIIDLVEQPVDTLGDLALVLLFLSALTFTGWALGKNVVSLAVKYENREKRGWKRLPPFIFVAQAAAIPTVLAIDAILIGAMIHLIW